MTPATREWIGLIEATTPSKAAAGPAARSVAAAAASNARIVFMKMSPVEPALGET
jgi:hypothetical protein